MISYQAALAPCPHPFRSPLGFRARALTIALVLGLFLGCVVGGGVLGPPPTWAAGGWTWPVKPTPAVTRTFQPPAQKWLSGHRGVDLGAAPGTEVRSPAAGTVSFAGVVVDRPVITVDHGDGLKSSFEPLAATVKRGQTVARGQVIGTIAAAGHCPPMDCVHWGVRRDGDYVNPLQFVQEMRPSVLLPVP